MTDSEIVCGAQLINRYLDNELHGDEFIRVRTHIAGCESCRTRLKDYEKIHSGLNSIIHTTPCASSVELENRVIESIRSKNKVGSKDWKDVIFSRKILVPAGIAVSIIWVFFTFYNTPMPVGPTAIVSSLSGSGSSVMILETPKTRETILWFSENG